MLISWESVGEVVWALGAAIYFWEGCGGEVLLGGLVLGRGSSSLSQQKDVTAPIYYYIV